MTSLHPDNLPVPQVRQPEAFSATPPHSAEPTEAAPEIPPEPDFEIQPLPDRPPLVDSRTPLRGMDLLYLLLFYFVTGGGVFFLLGTRAYLFSCVLPSEFIKTAVTSPPLLVTM